jgi:hypothetical protein
MAHGPFLTLRRPLVRVWFVGFTVPVDPGRAIERHRLASP